MKLYSVGTSRWAGPAKILQNDHGIPSVAFPGKNLEFITDQAIDMVKASGYNHKSDPAFVYITAGITDLTERVTYGYGDNKYQEVLFYEDIEVATNRVYAEYEKSQVKLLGVHGIMPVYSTVAPMSFWDWNYARLVQGKTSSLYHIEDYWVMQEDLEECIIELNNRIRELNTCSFPFFLTPRISDIVFQKKGADQPHRFRHNRFVDGVHPNNETVKKWAKEMLLTMTNNSDTWEEVEGEVAGGPA